MELLVTPASVFDLADAYGDDGVTPVSMTRDTFRRFSHQVHAGGAFTLRTAAGELAMVAGLYPVGEWAEAWFAVGPALRAHLRPALRIGRQLLEAVGADAAPLQVRTLTPVASVAGHQVARLFGMTRHGEIELAPFGRLVVWRRDF